MRGEQKKEACVMSLYIQFTYPLKYLINSQLKNSPKGALATTYKA